MKEKHAFRKILLSSLIGFPIGVTLLMIGYVCIYFISGESVFYSEISQLQNIHTLIYQLIITGFAYYLLLIAFNIISNLNNNKNATDKYVVEHPYKSILIISLSSLFFILILTLFDINIFSENMKIMNSIMMVLTFVLETLIFVIRSTIENNVIKKINQKIKERNK